MNTLRSTMLRTVLALSASAAPLAAQTVWHVDASAPPGGDGSSWSQAFHELDRGLRAATLGDSVWVAAGRYHPTMRTKASDPRSATFFVPQGVSLYGGFAGDELTLDERAGLFHATALSGDLGVPDDPSDNAYRVVTIYNPAGAPPGWTRLDGFTITRGNADLVGGGEQGGGIYAFNSATALENCILTQNHAYEGGAVAAQPGALTLVNCDISDNYALLLGGGLSGRALNVSAVNTIFARNTAGDGGGAAFLHSSMSLNTGRFVNCLFYENAADRGGAVFLPGGQFSSGKASFYGCTFAMNSAVTSGGALYTGSWFPIAAQSRAYNSILWDNAAPLGDQYQGATEVSYSNVLGGAFGTGNFSADPLFRDPAGGDFRLAPGSPCIDAGANALVPADFLDLNGNGNFDEPVPWDLDGSRRFADDPATPNTGPGRPPIVDMGAYEYQP